LQPGTTLGDLAYSSATANTNTRLPIGTSGQVLAVSGGGVPAWTTTADVTPLTTKGDLFTFTTVDARIGVGANGTILTADSAEATGLKWATPASGGKVLQVIYGSSTTDTTVSSGTFTDTTLSASITPSSATSKVLVLVSLVSGGANSTTVFQTNVRLVRASTSVWEPTYSSYPSMNNGGASSVELNSPIPINYLDSPSTTSATTYKMQGSRAQATGSARFQFGGSISTMILLEIGA
jgi:hypothetical protein